MDTSSYGVSAESSGVTVVKQHAEPTLTGYVDIDSWVLIEYAGSESYGVAANADASGLVYDHTFKAGLGALSDRLLSIAIEEGNTKGDEDIEDAILNSLNLNLNMSQRVGFEAQFIGKYPVAGANTSAFNTPVFFGAQNITVKITTGATRVADLAAATAANVKSGTVTRNYNVNNDDSAFIFNGTGDIADHHQQSKNAEITLEKFMTDNTFRNYEKLGTTIAVQIIIEGGSLLTGATTAKPKVVYTFPSCTVKRANGGDSNVLRTETLTITPHYGLDDVESASYMTKSVVTNLVATYEPS